MVKLQILVFLTFFKSGLSFLLEKKYADSIITSRRNKRANDGVFEETLQRSNYKRECFEEQCNMEEFQEFSENNLLPNIAKNHPKSQASPGSKLEQSYENLKIVEKFEAIKEATFSPCNAKYPKLLKNGYICDPQGVYKCDSLKQGEATCTCKPNYKQCEAGEKCGPEDTVRCKHLKKECSNKFNWDGMGITCDCDSFDETAAEIQKPSTFEHLRRLQLKPGQNNKISKNDTLSTFLHNKCLKQNPSYSFESGVKNKGSGFDGKFCNDFSPALHDLERASGCKACGPIHSGPEWPISPTIFKILKPHSTK